MTPSPIYGRRGRLGAANTGIRHTASTFGKARIGTYSEKANGHLTVDSDAERFAAHLLTLDPRVRAFQPQPFTVDLIEQRLLLSRDALANARRQYHEIQGPKFYTPDFSIDWQGGLRNALEVKAEGFEGDDEYWDKVARARTILAANGFPLRTVIYPADSAHPLRMNAHVLKQAAHRVAEHLTDDLVDSVTRLCDATPIPVATLCNTLALPPGLIPVLLISGVLAGNIARHPICGELEVCAAYGDLSHLSLLEGVEK
jgi:hypothetical protein